MAQQQTPNSLSLERLARLERFYDGPIPARLRRWALGQEEPVQATTPYLNRPLRSLAEVEQQRRAAE